MDIIPSGRLAGEEEFVIGIASDKTDLKSANADIQAFKTPILGSPLKTRWCERTETRWYQIAVAIKST